MSYLRLSPPGVPPFIEQEDVSVADVTGNAVVSIDSRVLPVRWTVRHLGAPLAATMCLQEMSDAGWTILDVNMRVGTVVAYRYGEEVSSD